MSKAIQVSNHIGELSAAIRRRPAMYFGSNGSRAISKIVRAIVQIALENMPGQYKGPIEVTLGQKVISIKFDGLAGAFFSPARFADVLSLPRDRSWITKMSSESLSPPQRKRVIREARREEFLYSVMAADWLEIIETNSNSVSKVTVENGELRLETKRQRNEQRSTEIKFVLPDKPFGRAGHNEVYAVSGDLRDLSLLRAGLTTRLKAAGRNEIEHCYERGIESLIFEEAHHRWLIYDGILHAAADDGQMKFECSISFVHAGAPRIHNWVNYYPTQGGAHLEAIGRALYELLGAGGCRCLPLVTNPDDEKIVHLWHSLVGGLHLETDRARFQGPTKDVLIGDDVFDFVYENAKRQFTEQWASLKDQRAL